MSMEQYIVAIEALNKRGEKPTLDAIRQEFGGGSYSTIIAARRLWQARGMVANVQETDMPSALASAMHELWRSAYTLAESQLASERAALAATRNEFEQSASELCGTADLLATSVEQLKAEVSTLSAERDALKLALDRVTVERDAYNGMLKAAIIDLKGGRTSPGTCVPELEAAETNLPF